MRRHRMAFKSENEKLQKVEFGILVSDVRLNVSAILGPRSRSQGRIMLTLKEMKGHTSFELMHGAIRTL